MSARLLLALSLVLTGVHPREAGAVQRPAPSEATVGLAGRVLDASGQALPGVQVRVAVDGAHALETSTDATGAWSAEGLVPGSLGIELFHPDHLLRERDLGRLAPRPEPHRLEDRLDAGRVVSGIVTWPDGAPAAGARVHAWQRTREDLELRGFEARRPVVADASGAFRFSGLAEEPVILRAHARRDEGRWPEESRREHRARLSETPHLRARVELAAPVEELVLTLEPGSVVRGEVLDDRGEPLEEVRVRTLFAHDVAVARTLRSANGEFELAGLPLEDFLLEFTAEGHARTLAPFEGSDTGSVEIRLPRLGRVGGVVLDGEGAPLSGATVTVTNPEAPPGPLLMPWSRSARTDAAGRFVLDAVVPGERCELLVEAGAAGRLLARERVVLPGTELADLELRVAATATIRGRLHESVRGFERVTVRLRGPALEDRQITDRAPDFAFSGLPEGPQRLILWADVPAAGGLPGYGLVLAERHVVLCAAETVELELGAPLESGVDVAGRITLRGEPAPDALVVFRTSRGRSAAAATVTDANGEYRLRLPREGTYEVDVRRADHVLRSVAEVEARAARQDFEFSGGELALRVLGPFGELRRELPIDLQRLDPRAARTAKRSGRVRGRGRATRSGADELRGRDVFDHLEPGTYLVRVGGVDPRDEGADHPVLGRVMRTVVIEEGETLELGLELVRPVTLTIREARPGLRVALLDEDGAPLFNHDDFPIGAGPERKLEGLSPGPLQVVFRRGEREQRVTVRLVAGLDNTLDAPL